MYINATLPIVKPAPVDTPDWVVTNPPFNRLMDFALLVLPRGLGVAIFGRTQALEGVGRFKSCSPTCRPLLLLHFADVYRW